MKINWVATNEIHRDIVAVEKLVEKQGIYRERILTPWKTMMGMMGGTFATDPNDEFGVARAWAWYVPEELNEIPQTLLQLEAGSAWRTGEEALIKAVETIGEGMPFDEVEGWLMPAVPERGMTMGYGYTGAIDWTFPRFVCQYDTVTERNLKALPGCVVHEFNHLVRMRVLPWNIQQASVADYIVHEGVAESFATGLFGEEVLGFYVADISTEDLQTARELIAASLDKTGFDVIRGYVFGDEISLRGGREAIGMPNFGGYAVGYHVVQAFMKRTGCSVADVTFTPSQQIVQESGYFS
jgi:uncharacterized protein YjaZ